MNIIKSTIIDYLPVPADNSTDLQAEVESILTGIYGPTLCDGCVTRDKESPSAWSWGDAARTGVRP